MTMPLVFLTLDQWSSDTQEQGSLRLLRLDWRAGHRLWKEEVQR